MPAGRAAVLDVARGLRDLEAVLEVTVVEPPAPATESSAQIDSALSSDLRHHFGRDDSQGRGVGQQILDALECDGSATAEDLPHAAAC